MEGGMSKADERVKWALIAGGTAAFASMLARRGLERGWRRFSGQHPPENPADPDVTWGHALVWAGASATVVALARLLALRGSAAGWKALKGSPPPM
jgi:hypothetical protein